MRGRIRARIKDKLYLFHLGGLLPYCVIVVLAIIFRVNQLNETGRCYIGLQRKSSFLLLIYDLVINVPPPNERWLTQRGIFDGAISYAYRGVIFV